MKLGQILRLQITTTFCLFLMLFSATAHSDILSDSNRIFDWAESKYSDLFPSQETTQLLDEWHYRYYPETNIYVGVNTNREVYVLGDIFNGFLRIDTADNLLAVVASDEYSIIKVSAGLQHTCAIKAGELYCWGRTDTGVIDVPADLGYVREVVTGRHHTCALDNTGVRCWGASNVGRLNIPPMVNPRQISADEHGDHTCALDDTGVVCWGYNYHGQTTVPAGITNPSIISVGSHHSCVKDESGVVCWGDSDIDQPVPSLTNVTHLAGGWSRHCAIDNSGIVCWKLVSFYSSFNLVIANPQEIDVTEDIACAIGASTNIECTGYDRYGMTGISNLTLSNPVSISLGGYHACVVDDNGVTCVGENDKGQCNVPAALRR